RGCRNTSDGLSRAASSGVVSTPTHRTVPSTRLGRSSLLRMTTLAIGTVTGSAAWPSALAGRYSAYLNSSAPTFSEPSLVPSTGGLLVGFLSVQAANVRQATATRAADRRRVIIESSGRSEQRFRFGHPGGVPAISRGWSAATPPDTPASAIF